MNYFVMSEVCMVESEGAWDKENREATVQAGRIIFLGANPRKSSRQKINFQVLRVFL